MLQDVRFALRLLVRRRTYAAAAVLTIALGIGLSATVFALVDGILFRALPYRDPDRLVALYGAARAEGQFVMSVSVPDVVDWGAASKTVHQIEAMESSCSARVRGGDETTLADCAAVSAGFFDMLGVRAEIGRTLAAGDFAPSAVPAAVITDRLWRTAFGSDPDVLGRQVGVGPVDYTIAGVLPRGFVFPNARMKPDVAIPLVPGARAHDRAARGLYAFGRLADGATVPQARAELDAIALRLKPLYTGRPNLRPGAFDGVTVRDLRYEMTRMSRPILWLLFGGAATVFAIACVNLVALLVAGNEDRQTELSVRAALGAGRWVLTRQLVVEATLLAAIGAGGGWLLTAASLGFVVRRIPQWLQLVGEPRLDDRVVVFAALLAGIAVLVGGVMPALRAAAGAPRASLGGGMRQATRRQRARHVIVAVEVALAMVLLAAGSVMMRSWMVLYAQDTGLDAAHLIAVRAVPAGRLDAPGRVRHNARMADAIRRVPGVSGIAFVDMPLLQRGVRGSSFVPPRNVPSPAGMDTDLMVTPDYFDVVGMRLLRGRGLVESDRGRAVVVTESLARRYWSSVNPVGTTIRYGDGTREIVGVISDARDVSLDSVPVPTLFHVWDDADAPVATMLVRFAGPSGAALAGVRQAIRAADDRAAVTMLSTVDDLLSRSVADRSFNTTLFTVFAAAALIVALAGVYGLVSLLVVRREREMGIRLALGATGRRLEVFVVSGTLRWIAGGVAAGVAGAVLCAPYLGPFVYHVRPNDPATLAGAAVAFLSAAALASYLPARRASRIDPAITLRAD